GMWFLNYFVFSLVTFFSVLAGAKPVQQLVNEIPKNLMAGLSATGGLLPAVGFSILMRMLWSKQLSPYYFLGFILAAYMKLPSVAVAAVGIIIVVIQWTRDKQLMSIETTQKKLAVSGVQNQADVTPTNESAQEEEDFFS